MINRTADIKFLEMCYEIDALKEEVDYWKQKYEILLSEHREQSKEMLSNAEKGAATALMFALSVRDASDGSLIIEKDDRAILSNFLKTI